MPPRRKTAQPAILPETEQSLATAPIGSRWRQRTHAAQSAAGLEHLASIGLDVRQGDAFEALPVRVELSCGAARIGSHYGSFTLQARSVAVQFAFDGARMKPGTALSLTQQSGSYAEATSRTISQEAGGEAAVSANASPAGAGFLGKLGFSAARKHKQETSIKQTLQADLVSKRGQNRFVFGEPGRGDLSRTDGCLAGTYPPKDTKEGDLPPLFTIEPVEDGAARPLPMFVTAIAVVPADQLVVRYNGRAASQGEAEAQIDDAKQAGEDALGAHMADLDRLREQMAQRFVADRLSRLQAGTRRGIEDAEIVVAVETRVIDPRGDDGTSDE